MEYPKFKVYVECFTFNQARFITDTMNGFTMQKTDFPFVCCIVDDASTDGEQDVIMGYVKENFNLSEGSVFYQKETDYANITYAQHKANSNCFFAVLLLKVNHYSQHKSKEQYLTEWEDGVPYKAFCEGDDYWVDERKLAKQVELMDSDSELGMCYTQYMTRSHKDEVSGGPYIELKQLIFVNTIGTLTTMLRQDIYLKYIRDIQPFDKGWKMGDYPIWLYMAAESKIGYINEPTAVYRVLSGSASHPDSLEKRLAFGDSVFDIKLFFNYRYNLGLEKQLERKRLSYRLVQTALKGNFSFLCRLYVEGIKADYHNLFVWKNYCCFAYLFTRVFNRNS